VRRCPTVRITTLDHPSVDWRRGIEE
jgi:hypothetical protein